MSIETLAALLGKHEDEPDEGYPRGRAEMMEHRIRIYPNSVEMEACKTSVFNEYEA